MPQVILVDTNVLVTDVYTINLINYIGADVILRDNAQGVIDLLHSHSSIDLIICRDKINREKTALEIYKFLKSWSKNIALIVLGSEPLIKKFSVQLEGEIDVKEVIKSAAHALGITPQMMAKSVVDDYIMVPIYYFLALDELICDLFIKARTEKGYVYQKKFSAKEPVNVEVFRYLIKKGVKNLYVSKDYRLKFTNQITASLINKIRKPNLTTQEKMGFVSSGMEIVREEFIREGSPSSEIIELMETSIQYVQNLVAQIPSLKLLLDNLSANKCSWAYKHCQLLTFIATRTIERLHWGGAEQYKLIAFVGYFHDISLSKDEMIKIDTAEKLKRANIKDEEKESVLKHAMNSARLVEKYPRSPMSADNIIKQHHGSILGIGFPKYYSNNLSPMAILFIIAEDLTTFFLDHTEKELSRSDYLIFLRKKYPRGMYLKVIEAMSAIL